MSNLTRIVHRARSHICVHAPCSCMSKLLQRHNMRNTYSQRILSNKAEKCPHCNVAAPPDSNSSVLIANILREFIDLVCVDHIYLDDLGLFHIVYTYSLFPAACPSSPHS